MKNPVIISLMALAVALLTLSSDNPASAQVVTLCIGNGQVTGRIVTGTPIGDFIDSSVSSGELGHIWVGRRRLDRRWPWGRHYRRRTR